jgi:IS30 family transposase
MRYAGQNKAAIARRLKRHRSTIERELKRNASAGGYYAVAAAGLARTRRFSRWHGRRKMDQEQVIRFVKLGLKQFWSPDQIAGLARREFRHEPSRQIGRQTLYNWIAYENWRGFDQ